jgi:hypothetical protein
MSMGSGTVLSTGALLQEKIQMLKQLLGAPLPDSRASIVLSDAKESGWASDVDHYSQKSAEYRTACHNTIRAANRDTIVKQASTCLRGDLQLHSSFLRKQSQHVLDLPQLNASTRSGAILAINNLISAEMTISDAIDAGVYTSVENLDDAKAKLRDQYRSPYWLSLIKIQANTKLTYIGLMLKRLSDILSENNSTPLIEKSTLQALSCLTSSVTAYQGIRSSSGAVIAENSLSDANKALPSCKDAVWTVAHLKSRQEQTSTGSSVLQTDAKK